MSYSALLRMRCNVKRLTETQVDGLVTQTWAIIAGGSNVRCFLDLNYIRAGRDPVWTEDSKTAQNRSGILFLPPKILAQPGDRIQMVKGPTGVFKIENSVDEAWTPTHRHHQELYVIEVDRVLAGG